jgi:tetratricopeptide (TPR) repeat protein
MRDSVLSALRRVIERRPEQAWAYVLLADRLVDAGRPAEALPILAAAERITPRDPMIARVRSVAYFRIGDYESAVTACLRVIELGAATSWDHAHLGYLRLGQGRYAEARRELEAATALEPARTEYLPGLGIALFHTGDPAASARVLERALAAQPDNLEARRYAAWAWWSLAKPERALAVLEALGPPRDPELAALADSIRSGIRPSP